MDDGRPEIFEHDPPRGRRRRNSKAARCRRSHVATSGRRRARRTDGGCTRGPSRRPRRGAPGPARGRGRAGVAEVHLRLLARGDLQPDARAGRRRGLAPQEAFHRGVAAAEAVLLDQQLPDRLALEPRACGSSTCSQNGSTNDCSWAADPGARAVERRQHAGLRQRACEQAVTLGPEPGVRDRVTADAEIPRDAPVRLAQLHPAARSP